MNINVNDTVKLDQEVINMYHKKLINNLQSRGYSAYKAGKAGISFITEKDIEQCVSAGSEKDYLESGVAYQILPYTENSSDWDEVRGLMVECIANNRYPFWADVISDTEEDEDGNEKNYTKVIGIYLVDSIIFDEEGNFFELVIDTMLMQQLSILPKQDGNIILDLTHVDKLLKQLTLCKRKDSSNFSKHITNSLVA